MFHTVKTGVAAFLFGVLALTACSQTDTPQREESRFIREDAEVDAQWRKTVNSDDLSIIGEVELDNGNVVRFIDERLEGETLNVGVVELIRANAGSAVSSLAASGELSPLELYFSLGGKWDAPEQLVLHHKSLARASATIPLNPRTLTAGLTTQTDQLKRCWNRGESRTGSAYYLNFADWVQSVFNPEPSNFDGGLNLTSTHYGVTGRSSKRALSTCNAEEFGGSVTYPSIQVQYAQNAWLNIPVGVPYLAPGEALFYYSSNRFTVPTRYRIKVWMPYKNWATAHTVGSW